MPESVYDKRGYLLWSFGFSGFLSDDGLFVLSDGQAKVIGSLEVHVDDATNGVLRRFERQSKK